MKFENYKPKDKREKLMDEILDKISQSGMGSISKDEMSILKNKGEVLPDMHNKTRMTIKPTTYTSSDETVSFYVKSINDVDFDMKVSQSMQSTLDLMSDELKVVELLGTLKVEDKEIEGVFYVSIDKEDYNNLPIGDEGSIVWDADFDIDQSKYKEQLDEIVEDIIIDNFGDTLIS